MHIEKWNPFNEMDAICSDMDKIWDEIFKAPKGSLFKAPTRRFENKKGVATPSIDIIDKGGHLLVRAEMPGVKKENITITLKDDILNIRGELTVESEDKDDNYYHLERNHKAFARGIRVPAKTDPSKITAHLKDGILDIKLPKLEDEKPRKIKIEAN